MPIGSVLVARHLFPSDTVFLSRSSTVAVLAEFAGPAAHAALLARELGIPCVGGIARIMELTHAGDDIIVDGTKGLALINPDQKTAQAYQRVIEEGHRARHPPIQIDRQPTVTENGIAVTVMANARSQEDVDLAIRSGAEGIGLFRTEPFFMASKHLPSAQDFTEFLARCLEPVGRLRVNVRLLDVGADKNPIYLPLPPEPDPFLGLRGVRVLLRYPDFLEAQLRALLDSSRRFNIGILIPMVTLESDVVQVIDTCRKLAAAMGVNEIPQIGAMIETPAAALTVRSLVKHVDFLSIGSNDLTQYTLAAGRENPAVTDYFIDDHPSVFRLMEMVIKDAGSTPVSLCGELAGRTAAIPELLRIGLRSLSVASSLLTEVRQTIRGSTVTVLEAAGR
jgi:phosphoenolpyruvate-protein kinase (PTS system EI component)